MAHEPGLDHDGLITDTARILRPVGSTHRKAPNSPKKVTLLRDCEPMEFTAFKTLLDSAVALLPTEIAQRYKAKNDAASGTVQYKPSQAAIIAGMCPVLAKIKSTKGNVSEPLWYAGIGVLRHTAESAQIIHEWSTGHPGYSTEETDAKIAQHKMGPTNCSTFFELCPDLCKECAHYGKITSPISLGNDKTTLEMPELTALNANHFVSRAGGKTVVCREVFDPELKRNKIEMSSFTDFRNFYCHQKLDIGVSRNGHPITMPLGHAWLAHPARRQYEDIKLTPEGDIDGIYNLWRGFSVKPAEGSWKLMRSHILNIICNSDKKAFRYVLGWLACLVQKPWVPGEVALVLQGKKGTGKGMFVNAFCRILGQHAMQIFNPKHLTGNFNAHLEDCILLYVDEAFWAGDKGGEGVLKGLITEPTIPIERKGCDIKSVRNLLHIVMASNNDWVVPASTDERRYCVLNVSDLHIDDKPYFDALSNETENGGLAAMLYYLQNKDISDFSVRVIPKTAGLVSQKILSFDPVQEWWFKKLQDGELLPGYKWGIVPCDALYNDYVLGVQKSGGIIRRGSDTSFGMQLRKNLPKEGTKKSKQPSENEARRCNHYSFPGLTICRKHFLKKIGADSIEWEEFINRYLAGVA